MAKLYIVDRYPAEYASGVYINDMVWAQFSVPISSGTATYYNFTVNEKNTYDPVDGSVEVRGISGGLNNAVIVFMTTNGFKRNTEYAVLASTGLKAKDTNDYLIDDSVWYFTTGTGVYSGLIGGVDAIVPSGITEDSTSGVIGADPSGAALEVIETIPEDFESNVSLSLPYIGIRFTGVIPSGVNLYDHISLTSKKVLG
ncbi:MAG TPA: Ig-like domain-containing protein [Patescibacteria group bacterium]|nr:Ig-like domain-containing protein [Patescibacteria group bacterium]